MRKGIIFIFLSLHETLSVAHTRPDLILAYIIISIAVNPAVVSEVGQGKNELRLISQDCNSRPLVMHINPMSEAECSSKSADKSILRESL